MTAKEKQKYDSIDEYIGINYGGWSDEAIVYILKRLLTDKDPSKEVTSPLKWCCYYGREKAVALLLKDGRVDETDPSIIGDAVDGNNINIVKMILKNKAVDPTSSKYYSIWIAWYNKEIDICKLLLAHSKIVIEEIPPKYQEDEDFMRLVKAVRDEEKHKKMGKFKDLLKFKE